MEDLLVGTGILTLFANTDEQNGLPLPTIAVRDDTEDTPLLLIVDSVLLTVLLLLLLPFENADTKEPRLVAIVAARQALDAILRVQLLFFDGAILDINTGIWDATMILKA